jgi:Fe-S cluster assembly ATP-binding protein
MLELNDIHLTLEADSGEMKAILQGVTCAFSPGKLYGVTGPNGGGKTSLAKVVMGIYAPTAGQVLLDGGDISGLTVSERAEAGISYGFQNPPRFKGITVMDILQLAGKSSGATPGQIRSALREVGLCPEDYVRRDLGSGLSGGEVKRIEAAQILLRDSKINIFDEPEAGVDLWTMQKLMNLLLRRYKRAQDKVTIVISHNERILPLCDEIIVIWEGRIQQMGAMHEVWHLIKGDIACQIKEFCLEDVTDEFI